MKKKGIAAATALGAILITTAIGASAQVTVDDAASAVTVSGVVKSAVSDVNIGIDVFNPGMSYSDLQNISASEYTRVFVHRDQAVSGEDGKWELKFRIEDDPNVDYDAMSGEYTVVIFPGDSETSYTEKFTYVNLEAAEAVINELKTASEAEIAQLIEENAVTLGIGYDFYEQLDKADIAKLLYNEIQSGALEGASVPAGIAVVRRAVLMCAVSEGRISNLFDYADVLEVGKSDIAPFVGKEYVKNNQSSITSGLTGKSFESFADFNDKLTEAAVLAVVKNPDGVGNVKEITDAFDDKIGFDAPLSSSAYRSVMGRKYNSYAELAKALKAGADTQSGGSDRPSGGGFGSGSGGGGSSVGGGSASGVLVPMESEAEEIPFDIFTDIDDVTWAKDAIVYLAEKGIVNGKEKGLFYPNDRVTREEAAKILVLAFAPGSEEAEIGYEDVSRDSWYYPYVAKAAGAGIVNGYSESIFGSGESITREDMVTMIYRAAVNSGIELEPGQVSFVDADEVADYAAEAIGALTRLEIVNGVDFQTFAPKNPATRAEMAKIIYRLLEK